MKKLIFLLFSTSIFAGKQISDQEIERLLKKGKKAFLLCVRRFSSSKDNIFQRKRIHKKCLELAKSKIDEDDIWESDIYTE